MPELPEVETIARSLRGDNAPRVDTAFREGGAPPSIVGRSIRSADVHWDRTIAAPETGFRVKIAGRTVASVGRRAKFLLLDLDAGALIIHLRMSGDLLVRPAGEPPAPHDRVVFHFEDGFDLAFNDTRKFGRVWLLDDPAELFAGLGPEPLGDEFTPDWLYENLLTRNRQIKPLLLDQRFLAGVGNIYADESLHRAGIHPLRGSNTVGREEAWALWGHLRDVLRESIRNNGASIDWVYRGGEFQNTFRVYGRAGERCPNCGGEIVKIVVGQRGTHLCPNCQPPTESA
jgi:formamidopyrimidine-DNA glycosylase